MWEAGAREDGGRQVEITSSDLLLTFVSIPVKKHKRSV
jgi:hypothetical protein